MRRKEGLCGVLRNIDFSLCLKGKGSERDCEAAVRKVGGRQGWCIMAARREYSNVLKLT